MRKAIVVLALLALAACGGSSALAPTPVSTPTPTPEPPNHSGTYTSATMTWSSDVGALEGNWGTITVIQDRELLTFSKLHLTNPAGLDTTLGIGTAVLDATDHFVGVGSYPSSGCGRVTVRTSGWFAGDYMNLTAQLTPAISSCGWVDVRGEMRR